MTLTAPPLSLAQQAGRRRDEQLVALVASALAPWPVRVYVLEHRDDVLRVALGRRDGAYLDVPVDELRHQLYRGAITLDEAVARIARQARKVWHSLEPLPVPANITLGQE